MDVDPFSLNTIPEGAVTSPLGDVVTEEEAVSELIVEIDDALDFVDSEYADKWAAAQNYYDGKVDAPTTAGRSGAVATMVRNAVSGARPSLMRIFTTSSIVEYLPSSRMSGQQAADQTAYINDLFFKQGGYRVLYDGIQTASLAGAAPVSWRYDPNLKPCYLTFTGADAAFADQLRADPRVTVLEERPVPVSFVDAYGQEQTVEFYDIDLAYLKSDGKIMIELHGLAGFFISRNATSVQDARVVGFERNMRVGDVLPLGVQPEDLDGLDASDPEIDRAMSVESFARRKSTKEVEAVSKDPMMKEVLITEAYARFDLDGMQVPQLWRFLLGGTERRLLLRERVEEVPITLLNIDFVPGVPIGSSLYEVAKPDQDTITSVLRGTLDNLHMSNNRRLAVHENLVNLKDVMSPKVGAPIRVRGTPNAVIQEVGVQPIIGAALPLLQYLDLQAQNRVGMSNASQGLDPDALQSTDKEAVRNTIMLSQGKIELMARNIAESLMPLFAGILKLSLQNMDRYQQLMSAPKTVDQAMFDPSATMRPKVGTGTQSVELQVMALQMVIGKQAEALATGPTNPMCNFEHVSNALEDFLKLHNLHNPNRYFRPIGQEEAAQLEEAAAAAAAEAAANAPPDPVTAMLQAEQIKADANIERARLEVIGKQREVSLQLAFETAKVIAADDLERDKLAQTRVIEFEKLDAQAETAKLQAEQAAKRPSPV